VVFAVLQRTIVSPGVRERAGRRRPRRASPVLQEALVDPAAPI
jgi:hypothetical protein